MSAVLDLEVGDADLAALVGVSPRWVREFAKRGALERIGRNRYRLGDALPALVAELTGGDIGEQINKARLAKLTADAQMAQLELAKARDEVALVSEFEHAQSAKYQIIQTNILGVPARAVLQLLGETDETIFKQTLRAELIQALKTAAETDPDLHNETDDYADDQP
ncbi:hypothetical protein [Cupriavidus sp. Agwp_2]|uniref:hypothetical protein n=1 Tax=Cupriavidus sp. Agwp_2 TaxID=2897324 RepID=UPI00345F8A1B